MMNISFVVAVARNGVIGKNNDLPWRLPDDMKFFMSKTKGHHVVLGRKNYDSLPAKFKPLPERTNIIVTHQKDFTVPGAVIVHSIEDAIAFARNNRETDLMIIGGAEIYKLAFPFANTLYITEIDADVEGDVYFPKFDKAEWTELERVHHPADAKHPYAFDFVVYQRK